MSDFVLQEDGSSHVLLEDGTSAVLLEFAGFVVPTIASSTAVYAPSVAYTGSQVTADASAQWLCPANVTQVQVECYGAGGSGYGETATNAGDGGGGGGAYAYTAVVPVTPGTFYSIIVGAGGIHANAGGNDGGDTSFTGDSSTLTLAKGGKKGNGTTAGAGGLASASTGDTKHDGGAGGTGVASPSTGGAGGGASGNRAATGNAGTNSVGGSNPGRAGGAGANGGGSGGGGATYATNDAVNGSRPGGGGGAGGGGSPGADGAGGRVILTAFPGPFIASVTVVYPPTLQGNIAVQFIASVSAVYAPALQGNVAVPFISSVTTVYALTLAGTATDLAVPFISSHTHVWAIFSEFDPNKTYGGPGNGGEAFLIRLNANGVTDTATLDSGIAAGSLYLSLSSDSAFPADKPFVVTIDDEVMLVYQVGPGSYHVRLRGISNTLAASHSAGSDVDWTDSYDQAITAANDIAHSFTADITSSGSFTYLGWLMCFDSSQAYTDTGDRYAMHVTEVLGVFDSGAGSSGSNRCDAAQPNAICTPAAVTDDCPAALSNPSLITSDIISGDVAVVRYTNPEATVLDLGPRAVALQSWFGMKRVDDTDNDVTLTDPNGNVVDTKNGEGTYTGSVNDEWGNPIPLIPGIAPDASDLAGHAVTTPNDVPYVSVTLPGSERYFTDSIHYSEKGWPIACLAVRQGPKRVPHWQSWDWHDYAYVYTGFGTDAVFAQILINRNGIVFGSVPEVDLPGPQDIDGPDAVWDDPNYFVGSSWYVVLFNAPYIVQGPIIGGTSTGPGGGGGGFTPGVSFPSGPGSPVIVPEPPVEGGEGGDINPSLAGLHVWQTS